MVVHDSLIPRAHPCSTCGKASKYHCNRCQLASYCSVECQHAHWRAPDGRAHRAYCVDIASLSKSVGQKNAAPLVEAEREARDAVRAFPDAGSLAQMYCCDRESTSERCASVGESRDGAAGGGESTTAVLTEYENAVSTSVRWMTGAAEEMTAVDLLESLRRSRRRGAAVASITDLESLTTEWLSFKTGFAPPPVDEDPTAATAELRATMLGRGLCASQQMFARVFELMRTLLTVADNDATTGGGILRYLTEGARSAWLRYVGPTLDSLGGLLAQCIRIIGTAIPAGVRALFTSLREYIDRFLTVLLAKFQSAASLVASLADATVSCFHAAYEHADLKRRAQRLALFVAAHFTATSDSEVVAQMDRSLAVDPLRRVAGALADLLRRAASAAGSAAASLLAHLRARPWFGALWRVAGIGVVLTGAGALAALTSVLQLSASVLDAQLSDGGLALLARFVTQTCVAHLFKHGLAYAFNAIHAAMDDAFARDTRTPGAAATQRSAMMRRLNALYGSASPEPPDTAAGKKDVEDELPRALRILSSLRAFYAYAAQHGDLTNAPMAGGDGASAAQRMTELDALRARADELAAARADASDKEGPDATATLRTTYGPRMWKTAGLFVEFASATDADARTRAGERLLASPEAQAFFTETTGHANPLVRANEYIVLTNDLRYAIALGYSDMQQFWQALLPREMTADPQLAAWSAAAGGEAATEARINARIKLGPTARKLYALRMGRPLTKDAFNGAIETLFFVMRNVETNILGSGNRDRQFALGLILNDAQTLEEQKRLTLRRLEELVEYAESVQHLYEDGIVDEMRSVFMDVESSKSAAWWRDARWGWLVIVVLLLGFGLGSYAYVHRTTYVREHQQAHVVNQLNTKDGKELDPDVRALVRWLHAPDPANDLETLGVSKWRVAEVAPDLDTLLPASSLTRSGVTTPLPPPPANQQNATTTTTTSPSSPALPARESSWELATSGQRLISTVSHMINYVSPSSLIPYEEPDAGARHVLSAKTRSHPIVRLTTREKYDVSSGAILSELRTKLTARRAKYEFKMNAFSRQKKTLTLLEIQEGLLDVNALGNSVYSPLGMDSDLFSLASTPDQTTLMRYPIAPPPRVTMARQYRWLNDFGSKLDEVLANDGQVADLLSVYLSDTAVIEEIKLDDKDAATRITESSVDKLNESDLTLVGSALKRVFLERIVALHDYTIESIDKMQSDQTREKNYKLFAEKWSVRQSAKTELNLKLPSFTESWSSPAGLVTNLYTLTTNVYNASSPLNILNYIGNALYNTFLLNYLKYFEDLNEDLNVVLRFAMNQYIDNGGLGLTYLAVTLPWLAFLARAKYLAPTAVTWKNFVGEPMALFAAGFFGTGTLQFIGDQTLLGKVLTIFPFVVGGYKVMGGISQLVTLGATWANPAAGAIVSQTAPTVLAGLASVQEDTIESFRALGLVSSSDEIVKLQTRLSEQRKEILKRAHAILGDEELRNITRKRLTLMLERVAQGNIRDNYQEEDDTVASSSG